MTTLDSEQIHEIMDGFTQSILDDSSYPERPYKIMVFEDAEGRIFTMEWLGKFGPLGSKFVEPISTAHLEGTTTEELLGHEPCIVYKLIAVMDYDGEPLVGYYDEITRG